MKKKLLFSLMLSILCILIFGAVNASAATYGDLTYKISNGKVTITDCNGSASGELVIPNTIDGYPVTTISSWAFSYCYSLKSVTIGNSVTTIGSDAFSCCSSLTSITIPDSVTTIGKAAFSDCDSLTSITIPDSVTTIGENAFQFCNCLTKINVSTNNKSYTSIDGVLFNKNATTLIQYPIGKTNNSYTIPDSVTTIGEYAFSGCDSLTSVTIPDSVTTIGDNAFYYCESLTSVTIPDSVTTIGNAAFSICERLTSVTIGDSVTTIGEDAFYYCNNLTSVNITDIAAWCNISFDNDSSNPLKYAHNLYLNGTLVTNLVIPNSVTTIGEDAFRYCDSLTSVTIPDSVTTIGSYAFSNCDSLTSVTISNGVKTIGEKAFYSCDSLTSITIPDSVTTIGNSAFESCLDLTSVTIGNSVTTIGEDAFYNCDSLTSVTIPDSVTSIGYHAFYDCDSLTSVTIGNSVTTIGEEAFYDCSELKNVNITDVAAWCNILFDDYSSNPLYYANNLYLNGTLVTNLVIPDSVTTIGSSAFRNCDSLTSVTIPDSVTTIGSSAFRNCDSLTSVTIPDSVTTIGGYAFYDCDSLTSVTIPDSVTSIGGYAFYHCDSLTSITIPDSVTTIGSYAFSWCKSLTSVTIPDSVTTISWYAFSYCDSLTSITLPDSVTTIGSYAFCDCTKLTCITIPDGVKTIGEYAFYYCDSLKDVYYNGTETEWNKISISSYNNALKNATRHYFMYVTIYDENNNIISKKTCDLNKTIDIYDLNKYGYTIHIYTDKDCTQEFDIATTPITKNLVLYLRYVRLNDMVLSGDTKAEPGDTITQRATFATDKNISYITATIKYPKVLTFKKLSAPDFAEASVESEETKNGYHYLHIIGVYDYNKTAPVNTNMVPFEIQFEVATDATIGDAEISLENVCLIGESDIHIDNVTNSIVTICPKLAESMTIAGSDSIDKATTYTAIIYPDYTTSKEVIWYVDDDTVATISQEGVLTPVRTGVVTITATTKDGSGVLAYKTVNIVAYAKIDAIRFDKGVVNIAYDSKLREYTVYVDEDADSITLTPTFTDGILRPNGSGLWISGRSKTFSLTDDTTIITLNRESVEGMTNSDYVINVVKVHIETDISTDGKVITVTPVNIDKKCHIIIAVYNDGIMTEIQNNEYTGEAVDFSTDEEYTEVKIMLWDGKSGLRPLCKPEILK